ncbi:hypothetical protein GCM10023185_06740 [Hymenobacter saemangeumensis]|uniref:LamG-like jellyroll fold domain-containing protein n=1 Tax=Hymenobacter saemangeumensis TaxID=1084522 RepID=A0ABP8I2A0_9BACT
MPKFVTSNGKLLTATNAGSALYFSSNPNSGVIPPASNIYQNPNQITVECWAFPQQIASAGLTMALFFTSRLASNYQWYWRLDPFGAAANKNSKMVLTHYGTGLPYTGNAVIPSDAWVHLAFTFNKDLPSGQLRFYVNGQIDAIFNTGNVASTTITGGLPNIGWGYLDSNGAHRFRGLLDTCRIWNYARSAAQIASAYLTRLVPLESGLIADYGFDSTGTTAFDRSSQVNNAAIGGSGSGLTSMARQGSTIPYTDNTTGSLIII